MDIDYRGHAFLITLEGLKQKAYMDSAGHWTIGVGHLLKQDELSQGSVFLNGRWYPYESGLNKRLVIGLYLFDSGWANKTVNECLPDITRTQAQHNALCSLCFNIGRFAFKRSSAVRSMLKYAPPEETAKNIGLFHKITNSQGNRVPHQGLINRRKKEMHLFLNGIYT